MRQIITVWLALLLSPALSAQTMTDTLWSVPGLDGGIGYRPASGIFNLVISGVDFTTGDGWDAFLSQEYFARSYPVLSTN